MQQQAQTMSPAAETGGSSAVCIDSIPSTRSNLLIDFHTSHLQSISLRLPHRAMHARATAAIPSILARPFAAKAMPHKSGANGLSNHWRQRLFCATAKSTSALSSDAFDH
jgi:hypothetical protein|eukprot:Tamp_36625.p2 GENE.Tamp_36625~~Tamp_36625.p2  ORF type:complete len:110 (-),score=2.98 Tamp_36625:51-380(-)